MRPLPAFLLRHRWLLGSAGALVLLLGAVTAHFRDEPPPPPEAIAVPSFVEPNEAAATALGAVIPALVPDKITPEEAELLVADPDDPDLLPHTQKRRALLENCLRRFSRIRDVWSARLDADPFTPQTFTLPAAATGEDDIPVRHLALVRLTAIVHAARGENDACIRVLDTAETRYRRAAAATAEPETADLWIQAGLELVRLREKLAVETRDRALALRLLETATAPGAGESEIIAHHRRCCRNATLGHGLAALAEWREFDPVEFPALDTDLGEWADFTRRALIDRLARLNLRHNATLNAVVAAVGTELAELDRLARDEPLTPYPDDGYLEETDLARIFRHNGEGRYAVLQSLPSSAAGCASALDSLRLAAGRAALLRHRIRHDGKLPASLDSLGIPARFLRSAYDHRPFVYDPAAATLACDPETFDLPVPRCLTPAPPPAGE